MVTPLVAMVTPLASAHGCRLDAEAGRLVDSPATPLTAHGNQLPSMPRPGMTAQITQIGVHRPARSRGVRPHQNGGSPRGYPADSDSSCRLVTPPNISRPVSLCVVGLEVNVRSRQAVLQILEAPGRGQRQHNVRASFARGWISAGFRAGGCSRRNLWRSRGTHSGLHG